MKLGALKSRLPTLRPSLGRAPTKSDQRMAGRKLQDRRMRLWSANPCCAMCGRLTDWPYGFDVDHRIRLDQGGPDTDENCQILCTHTDDQGRKAGCHAEKTKREMQGKAWSIA